MDKNTDELVSASEDEHGLSLESGQCNRVCCHEHWLERLVISCRLSNVGESKLLNDVK